MVEALLEVVGRHADVAENVSESTDSPRAIAVDGHDGINVVARQHMVTAADPECLKLAASTKLGTHGSQAA